MASLTVIAPFGAYGRGQSITDAAVIAAILASPQRIFVVTVADSSPGTGIVAPTQPNAVTPVVGMPSTALATTYGFALDLTSTPNALYKWSGTAWAIILQAGSGGGTAPVLQPLGLSTLIATVGVAFSATISGQTAGSTVVATSSDGAVLSVANGQVSGTFTAAGLPTISLTETPAGGGASKTTQLAMTVGAAVVDRTATTDLSNPDRGLNPLI